jgi:SAM-dependent methyltransferase
VGRQFGSQAAAYLNSAVHAGGPDLQALTALVDPGRQARVLDLGCGAGHVSFAVAERAKEVVAYDLSAEMLSVVNEAAAKRGLDNLTIAQGAVERLPFADESFDCVLSRFSAHHWRDVDAGLREAARALRSGGLAAFVDVVSPGPPLLDTWLQGIELLRDPSHVRDLSCAEWDMAATRAGLRVKRLALSRLHLDFEPWVSRMRTPKVLVEAIRALQAAASETVARHFAIEADGSFTLDVLLLEAMKP